MARKPAGPESEFRLARGTVGTHTRDNAIIPVLRRSKGLFDLSRKTTGVFVFGRRADYNEKPGPFGGITHIVRVHVGNPNITRNGLRPAEGDPDLGTNKAGRAERAARTAATVWLEDHPREADDAIRAMIEDAKPKNGASGRRGRGR